MMPVYIDIGAVRIQEWLARTPELALRRGASAALSEATSEARITPLLPDGVVWNSEAGDVDGVVNLRLHAGDEALSKSVTRDVLAHLRGELPAVDWSVGVAEAADYFSAYPALNRSRADGTYSPAPAATAELPFARPCQTCGLDPGSATRKRPGGDVLVCRDCATRADAAGRASGSQRHEPASSRLLRGWLTSAQLCATDARFPADFEALADLDGATHIATVYADGNALGQAFGAAKSGAKKSALAQAIRDATRDGAVAAVRAITETADEDVIPIVAHTIGGDDLLVSVPPHRAWRFTRTYLEVFASTMASRMEEVFGPQRHARPKPITASAGIVHAHRSFPIGLQIEAAEGAMRLAKYREGPDTAAVAWLDVTADGHLATAHGPWQLSDLLKRWSDLDALYRATPASQRSRLLRLLEDEFSDQVRRLDLKEARAVGTGWGGRPETLDEARVKQALRIVRWWS